MTSRHALIFLLLAFNGGNTAVAEQAANGRATENDADVKFAEGEKEADEPLFEDAAEAEAVVKRRGDEGSLLEDPEAQRRAERTTAEAVGSGNESEVGGSLDFYGSARVHAINTIVVRTGKRSSEISDGQSRVGVRAEWTSRGGIGLFGRYEAGFDLVENFSTRGAQFGDGGLTTRLASIGVETDNLLVIGGQNWSTYYQVAGMTDRFAIFGGSASGVYNAGTAGEFTGTGRAKDVIQTRVYADINRGLLQRFKPINVNLQYQLGQDIPGIQGQRYTDSFGLSTVLETQGELGIGLAYNRANIRPGVAEIEAAGIDGNAEAFAVTLRTFGPRWYVAGLVARQRNMNVTNENRYFNAYGYELYAQWEAWDNWWLVGGGNWLIPDEDDPQIGQFRVAYYVLGARYTLRSFQRMFYVEYRHDQSRFVDGNTGKDEITIGLRWDFGRQ